MGIRNVQRARRVAEIAGQLAAAEQRHRELATTVVELRRELGELRATTAALRDEIDVTARVHADEVGTRVEALSSRTREEQRRLAAAIDVLRRHQKSVEERLTAGDTERRADSERIQHAVAQHSDLSAQQAAALTGLTATLDAAVTRLDGGLHRTRRDHDTAVDDLRRATDTALTEQRRATDTTLTDIRREYQERLGRIDGQLDAVSTALVTDRARWEARTTSLGDRADRLEADATETTRRLDEVDGFHTELTTALDHLGATVSEAAQQIVALDARVGSLDQRSTDEHERVDLVVDRLEPVGRALSTVNRLDESVAAISDRLTAAELLLNQREDLEMQLDRAEELERLIAEIDPDRFASKAELETLRHLVEGPADDNHTE